MILTQLPDLPPRPQTPRNAAFRRMFYSRWGKENWVVCGHAQDARYFEYRQTCSIKAVFKGSEHYYIDRRRLTVTDETYLLARMLRRDQQLAELPERIECVRASKRRELMRRLNWATDFMHSNLERALTLDDIARAARLSSFHFLRTFRQAYRVTPMEYLREQRTRRALALLATTQLPVAEVAQLVGLSRLSLWRSVSRMAGRNPKSVRAGQL
ncbi:MAG: helix-turn-helix domain-containing protein [Steroidobacteraceae bacterium]